MAVQELISNTKFVAGQFGEYIDDTKEKAKIEVHAYIENAIRRTGIVALQGKTGEEHFQLASPPSGRIIDMDEVGRNAKTK